MSDLRAAVEQVCRDWGISEHYSRDGIHGWRCEYEDRYGPCGDFQAFIDDLMLAIEGPVQPSPHEHTYVWAIWASGGTASVSPGGRGMTQQEALAQALRSGKAARTFSGYLDGEHGIEVAVDAILDALPEDCTLVTNWGEWTLNLQELGAQQERKRLEAEAGELHGRRVLPVEMYNVFCSLLADPEDEA